MPIVIYKIQRFLGDCIGLFFLVRPAISMMPPKSSHEIQNFHYQIFGQILNPTTGVALLESQLLTKYFLCKNSRKNGPNPDNFPLDNNFLSYWLCTKFSSQISI